MARKAGLERKDVLDAAAQIADADGLDAVTLVSVANRLGIRAPSLYAHVDGLDGLRRQLALHAAVAMADALQRAADRRDGRDGRDALRAIAHAYRAFARQHPGWYAAAQRAVQPGKTTSSTPPSRRWLVRRSKRWGTRAFPPRNECTSREPFAPHCTGSSASSRSADSACPSRWTRASAGSSICCSPA